MNSNYETLYGVGLLDDLHNHFPALLYDSSGFASVQDVLRYIQMQTRNRFDLFSYGLREYQSTHPLPSPPVQNANVNNLYRRVVRTSYAGMPAPLQSPHSTLLRQPATAASPPSVSEAVNQNILRANVPNIQVELNTFTNEEEEEEEDEQPMNDSRLITNALLSLLALPGGNLSRTYDIDAFGTILTARTQGQMQRQGMDQFLQPVVVRPTPQQISENTTLGRHVSDTEQACAICQDALTEEQEGRKLNACGHWFHKNCIDTWLSGNVHCPVCRHDIRESIRQNSPADEEQKQDQDQP